MQLLLLKLFQIRLFDQLYCMQNKLIVKCYYYE